MRKVPPGKVTRFCRAWWAALSVWCVVWAMYGVPQVFWVHGSIPFRIWAFTAAAAAATAFASAKSVEWTAPIIATALVGRAVATAWIEGPWTGQRTTSLASHLLIACACVVIATSDVGSRIGRSNVG